MQDRKIEYFADGYSEDVVYGINMMLASLGFLIFTVYPLLFVLNATPGQDKQFNFRTLLILYSAIQGFFVLVWPLFTKASRAWANNMNDRFTNHKVLTVRQQRALDPRRKRVYIYDQRVLVTTWTTAVVVFLANVAACTTFLLTVLNNDPALYRELVLQYVPPFDEILIPFVALMIFVGCSNAYAAYFVARGAAVYFFSQKNVSAVDANDALKQRHHLENVAGTGATGPTTTSIANVANGNGNNNNNNNL